MLGTFANCSGGLTPWGTVLSGEENFNGYFDKSGSLDSRYTAQYARYGITGSGSRGWSEVDSRFDLSVEPHEVHRFGWIVEIDPLKPNEAPKKHTMLGRVKHEGANVVVAKNGKVVFEAMDGYARLEHRPKGWDKAMVVINREWTKVLNGEQSIGGMISIAKPEAEAILKTEQGG